jgi:hypothetical protein
VYADVFDIEGLVSSPYGPGRKADILEVIDCYAKDYANLRTYSDEYPAPDALRALTKQGETERPPYAGVRGSTEGSDWILHCARRKDPRPHIGAKSVNRWRVDFLRDFAQRMVRCERPHVQSRSTKESVR